MYSSRGQTRRSKSGRGRERASAGLGLTSVDMIMGLKSKGFRGTIHVLSREGLVPSRHQPSKAWPLLG